MYGDNLALMGGFAEYALAPEAALAPKPPELTFAEASTIPQAGAIALKGTEGVAAGDRVLVNGAGGGSGSFAIQLAKRLGAHVTGVDNAAKQDHMRSVGADSVVDYERDDFTRRASRTTWSWTWSRTGRSSPTGALSRPVAGTAASAGRSARCCACPRWAGRSGGPPASIGVLMVNQGPAHFVPLADLCVSGDVRIHIDRCVTLDEVPAALARVGEGRALGKVVVSLDPQKS